ncbi:MAG: tRNA pseudouridine(55) synthase TruB [Sandaracinaceae bacterium]
MGRRRRSTVHGVLVVDKPRGPTSHDLVSRGRRAFGTRSVGHAGTLDPMATGVLVLGVGEGTKLLRWMTADDKAYTATVRLGEETDTLDAEGAVTARAPVGDITLASAREVARAFVGTFEQTPPIYSALKQGGESLHAKARRGEAVEVPTREVTVHDLSIDAVRPDSLDLSVSSAKGFYVRSLGRDLALALSTRGHLVALRRTRSGPFTLDDAVDGACLAAAAAGDDEARATVHGALMSLTEACRSMPRLDVTERGANDARHGRPVALSDVQPTSVDLDSPMSGPIALVGPDGALIAVAEKRDAHLRVLRGIRTSEE